MLSLFKKNPIELNFSQSTAFLEKLVLPLKLLLQIVSDDIGTPDLPPSFYQLFVLFFKYFFPYVLEGWKSTLM